MADNKKVEIPKGMMAIVGSDKSKHLETGVEYIVSDELAKNLIKNGHATKK